MASGVHTVEDRAPPLGALADADVKGTQITVETKGNVVTLGGTAETAAARAKAIEIATATKGVSKVIADGLVVQP